MQKHYFLSWILVGASFFSFHGLRAWTIENIQNDLPYPVSIEFLNHQEDSAVVLYIDSGANAQFGYPCPFAQDRPFEDFEMLPTTLSIAPKSHPLCKGFIAEGFCKLIGAPATFYYQDGSPRPRIYIIRATLGYLSINKDSSPIYATLRLFEKDCDSKKKGMRKRMYCELVNIRYLLEDGSFSTKPI